MKIVKVTPKNIELAEKAFSFIFDTNKKVNIDYFSNPNNYFFVAIEGNEVVGAIYGNEFDRPDSNNKQLFIYSVDIKKEFRRKGYGRALLNHFINIIENGNYHNVFLLVNNDNIPAIKLYDSIQSKKINKKVIEQILFGWNLNDLKD